MKRYSPDLFQEDRHGSPLATMIDDPTGNYIRHDDADLAALVEAATEACRYADMFSDDGDPIDAHQRDLWILALRNALAAAAPGTTTRGGGE